MSPEPTYRQAARREPPEPRVAAPLEIGEPLEPTANDRAALERLRLRERSSAVGIALCGSVLIRWIAPFIRTSALSYGVMFVGGALILYAILRFAAPPSIGHPIVRLSSANGVRAGARLDVTLLLQPRDRLTLAPLVVRLFATRAEGDRTEVAYEAVARLAHLTIEADEAVHIEANIPIPDDAPPTSSEPRVRWRVEVKMGEEGRMLRSAAVRVQEPTRRKRRRVEHS